MPLGVEQEGKQVVYNDLLCFNHLVCMLSISVSTDTFYPLIPGSKKSLYIADAFHLFQS